MKKQIIEIAIIILLCASVQAQPNGIFRGGSGNGYSQQSSISVNLNHYKGGSNDGYFSTYSVASNLNHYKGGHDDGYSSVSLIQDFIWTGTVGQGWTVPGNWNLNVIPTSDRKTIIPAGVPSFPYINAGVFAIGSNPTNSQYKSGELIIMPGALLVTRVNCKVENYGMIEIGGEMKVRNSSNDAFANKAIGKVNVLPGGLFIFQ